LRRRLLVFSEALICLSYSGVACRAVARQAKAGPPSRSSKSEGWSSRVVTLRGLSLIGRVLYF
jgi:hypothetical protein